MRVRAWTCGVCVCVCVSGLCFTAFYIIIGRAAFEYFNRLRYYGHEIYKCPLIWSHKRISDYIRNARARVYIILFLSLGKSKSGRTYVNGHKGGGGVLFTKYKIYIKKKTKGPLLLLCVRDVMKYMMEKNVYIMHSLYLPREYFFTRFPSFGARQL